MPATPGGQIFLPFFKITVPKHPFQVGTDVDNLRQTAFPPKNSVFPEKQVAFWHKPTTFGSYESMVKQTIEPYFRNKPITLKDLEARHIQQFYSEKLKEVVKGTKLELPVLVAVFYGLRRGEVLGLKWDAIDFERGTLTIKRTVISVSVGGKTQIIEQESAKTKSSMRISAGGKIQGILCGGQGGAGDGERYAASRSGRFRQQMGAKRRKSGK